MAKRRRSAGARNRQIRQQRLLIGAVVLAAILVVGVFSIANRKTADTGYYKHVTPAQLDRVVQGSEPVLVYFHSPT